MVWRVGRINLRSSFFQRSYLTWLTIHIFYRGSTFEATAPNQTHTGFCYGIHTYSNVRVRSQKDWYLCNGRLYSVSYMFFEIVLIIALLRDLWNMLLFRLFCEFFQLRHIANSGVTIWRLQICSKVAEAIPEVGALKDAYHRLGCYNLEVWPCVNSGDPGACQCGCKLSNLEISINLEFVLVYLCDFCFEWASFWNCDIDFFATVEQTNRCKSDEQFKKTLVV